MRFLTVLVAALALPGAALAEETLSLERTVAEVLERNPDLAAWDAERAAALDRSVAAGAFPDPTLGLAIRNWPIPSFSFEEDMMTMKEIMVRQRIPLFGKRGLAEEAEAQGAEVAEANADAQRLLLAEAATAAYANLWLAHESRSIVEAQRETLARFSSLARGRYAAGAGSQADLLRADVELSRIDAPLHDLDVSETSSRAALAALLDTDAVDGTPAAPPVPRLPEASVLSAIDGHPELRALAEQQKQAEIRSRLALRERWPDPEIGLAYGQRDMEMDDMIGVEVMFRLPIFSSSREAKLSAAAKGEARALEHRRTSRRNALVAEAKAAYAAVRQQRHLIELYEEEIVPRAGRNVEAAIGSYQAGGVDFLTLLEAQVQLYTQQLEALRARASYVRALARLERALGTNILSTGVSDE